VHGRIKTSARHDVSEDVVVYGSKSGSSTLTEGSDVVQWIHSRALIISLPPEYKRSFSSLEPHLSHGEGVELHHWRDRLERVANGKQCVNPSGGATRPSAIYEVSTRRKMNVAAPIGGQGLLVANCWSRGLKSSHGFALTFNSHIFIPVKRHLLAKAR